MHSHKYQVSGWYVSNVYIIYVVFMLLYYQPWMFYMHLYAILYDFGTNILTQSPVPVSVFPCFRVSQKRKIKRSPTDLKLHGTYFLTRRSPRSIRDGPEESRAAHEGGGRAHPPGRAPCLVDSPEVHWRTSSSHIYPYTLKTPGSTIDREFCL